MREASGPTVTSPPSARTLIRPPTGWAALRLGEVWSHRELLYFFIWRDIKVRYRQTAFGALWAIIQPLGFMAVFTVFLGRLEGISPEDIPYALFALTALVPWTLFSQSVIGASDSLVGSANLLQKVYFPRLLLPLAEAGARLLDFAIGFVLLLVAMVLLGVVPGLEALWVLPLTALALTASMAVGVWLAAINVRYRDVRYAVPFLVQIWLFASPVAYSSALVPPGLETIYYLNPMAGVIDGFRWALLGDGAPPVGPVLLSVAVTSLVLVSGLAYFRRVERALADVI
jgi:lipopolysaccharide transport system permease protein